MTRKQRRSLLIVVAVGILMLASILMLFALRDTIVFFYTPSEVLEKRIVSGQKFRLGGLVTKGSVKRGQGTSVTFSITDTEKTINVSYKGVLPDLFREGQGVVAEGALTTSGAFVAETVLAKHDEQYMPPEVAKALKKKQVWKGKQGSGPVNN